VEQLKIGHVYFQPSEDRIEIQLEVFDHSGAVTATESVLALASGLPVQRPAETPAEVSQESNATAVAEPEKVAEAPETQPSRPPVRTFTMPPPKPRSGEEGRVILPEMPAAPLSGSGNAPDLDLPAGVNGLSGAGRIAAPAVQEPPQAKEPPAKQPLKVGGNVQAANLIKKVTPIYPQLAQVARTQGTVRFTALIGKDGRIRNLELVSGPPALVPAAGDAVKQWVYRPTLLNGEPVEVITQIDVTFTLNR
jgi:protein TonB